MLENSLCKGGGKFNLLCRAGQGRAWQGHRYSINLGICRVGGASLQVFLYTFRLKKQVSGVGGLAALAKRDCMNTRLHLILSNHVIFVFKQN